ncbi:MAG: DUF998 domain-containing protein [Candidatus Gribaldobacteria bacterium]|nr:DUF998 domain-containing protein [Candidatus Gribaldobacteria bacterium]
MEKIIQIEKFLSAYLVFLPLCFAILFLVVRKRYKNYSVLTFWLSNLGAKKSRSRFIFNICFFVFGLFNLLFCLILFEILPQTFLTLVMLVFLSLAAIFTVFIPFFPMDKKRKAHETIANFLFFCILAACLLFTYFNLISQMFPVFLTVFSLVVVVFSFLTVYSYLKLKAKYGERAMGDLVFERKKEKSFILKNATLWEWLVFSSVIVWLFVLAACLLNTLP